MPYCQIKKCRQPDDQDDDEYSGLDYRIRKDYLTAPRKGRSSFAPAPDTAGVTGS